MKDPESGVITSMEEEIVQECFKHINIEQKWKVVKINEHAYNPSLLKEMSRGRYPYKLHCEYKVTVNVHSTKAILFSLFVQKC